MSTSPSAAAVTPTAPPSAFEALAAQRVGEAEHLLNLRRWQVWSWYRRPWDSEARKSLARISTSIETARQWNDAGTLEPRTRLDLERALDGPLTGRSLDTLIEQVYALDELLVAAGDAEFLRRRLCAEDLPDGDDTRLVDVRQALSACPSLQERSDLESTRQTLRALYEMRRFRYRRLRARRRMKSAVLLLAGTMLLALVVVLAICIDTAQGGTPSPVLLAGSAGALGGTLANLLRLRDNLRRGTELREFKPLLLAQPAVGAASGLVILLVIEGGFLGIGDQESEVRWATTTMLAFAAGFSEALFIGIVRRASDAFSDVKRPADSDPGTEPPAPGTGGPRVP